MKIGIDAYCFHRFFGEIYPEIETHPGTRMTVRDLLDAAVALGVDGISIEHFMLAPDDDAARIGEDARNAGIEVMWAWGHPDGLGSGHRPDQLHDLRRHVDLAAAAGARVMRICGGGRRTRPDSWSQHRALLTPLLAQAAEYAGDRGVTLALENHIDFTSEQIVEIVEAVASRHLGICLDTANQLRMLEDPRLAIRRMAPYAVASHVKDVRAHRGDPHTFSFWPSVPIGEGVIDLPDAVTALREHGFDGLLAIEIDYLHPDHPSLDDALRTSVARLREIVSAAS